MFAGGLSQREQDVLAQIARRRSNKAIADALYVSPNTVKTHVASLLRKFEVHSRAQLMAIAAQHGMPGEVESLAAIHPNGGRGGAAALLHWRPPAGDAGSESVRKGSRS